MKKDVLKFSEFIKEAKEEGKKDKALTLLNKLMTTKPSISMEVQWPTEKGIYSLAGIKKYFKDNGLTNNDADQALNTLQNSKEKIKSVAVKNYFYNQTFPYWFINATTEEVKAIKDKLETYSKEQAKPEIEKKKEVAKKAEEGKKAKAELAKTKRKPKGTTKTK